MTPKSKFSQNGLIFSLSGLVFIAAYFATSNKIFLIPFILGELLAAAFMFAYLRG